MDGGTTSVNSVSHLYGYGGGYLTDELWVTQPSGCSGPCWVESGMESGNDTGNTQYIWADMRPNGGGFYVHYFGVAPSGDYGHQATFQIWRNSSSTFTAAVFTYTSSYYGYSTSNPITLSMILAGSELSGQGTVYPEASQAPVVHFVANMWKKPGTSQWNYQDDRYYQTGSGYGYAGGGPPPFIYDVSDPVGSFNHGGDFETWCC